MKNISTGVVPASAKAKAGRHKVPADLRRALTSDPIAIAKWNALTPLARNEWICWIMYVKKPETRRVHVKRTISELKEGERRPCCWIGCPHRNPNAKKWFERLKLNK